MQDCHIHIEKGPYTLEWIQLFVNQAVLMNLDKICLLEHSHRFIEFEPIYASVKSNVECGEYQRNWLSEKCERSLDEYKKLIVEMRQVEFPIEVQFGLEVCFIPGEEGIISDIISGFDWDFVTGSVHFINGWGFDHRSNLHIWATKNIDEIYNSYYREMIALVTSGLFTNLAHPDSIKCFNYYSHSDLQGLYVELACAVKEKRMRVEFNNGLYINYGHEELGTNRKLLKILLDNNIEIVTASDAHKPEDVGKFILEARKIISEIG